MNEQSRPPRVRAGVSLGALIALPMLVWAAPAAAEPEPAPAAAPAVEPTADAPAVEPAPAADAPTVDATPPAPDAVVAPEVVAAPSVAVEPAPVATPSAMAASASLTVHAPMVDRRPWIGAMADVGVPDGASASVVVRPIRAIRAYAGLSHNMISLGQRVGVTLTPGWWISPTLSVEYGHYAEGNANPLVRAVAGDPTISSAVLERVGYSYASGRIGLELGRTWFTFYLHAGMSRVTGAVHNLSSETMSEAAGTTTVTFTRDPNVRLWAPSASLGFIVYLAK